MTRRLSRTHLKTRPVEVRSRLASSTLAMLLAAAPLPPGLASAQDPSDSPTTAATDEGSMGRIVVLLIDGETAAPITEALVTLEALNRRTLSDSAGTAVFLDVPPGAYTLGFRHIAYGEQTALVDVEGMTSAVMGVQLDPRAIAVAPLEVLIEQRPRYLEQQGFYDRRAVAMGSFFDPLFVERWGQGAQASGTRFIELLADMSPQLSSVSGNVTGNPTANAASNGSGSIGNGLLGQCPAVYIDGQRTFNDPGLAGRSSLELDMLSTYTIGAVEIYASSQGVPDFALEPEVGCGSIVIWTNRWRGRTRNLGGGDQMLCEPEDMTRFQVEGEIRDEFTGVLLPGAHVVATTFRASDRESLEAEEIIADANGRYRVCDVPGDHALTLQVAAADRTGPETQIPLTGGPILTHDLSLRVAGPGRVVGRVLDRSTGEPVSTASVGMVGANRRTQTDDHGYFVMDEVMPGDHVVEIEHLSFEAITEIVSVVANRTVDLSVQLSANPIELEPLVVTAIRDRRLEIRGFYDRRTWGERTGLGEFLSDADIERRSPAAVTNVLREMSGVELQCSGRDCVVTSSRTTGCSTINIYINGTLTLGESRPNRGNRPLSIDELVRPSEIAGMEVYAGGATVPAEFSGLSGRCGAIAIWTR